MWVSAAKDEGLRYSRVLPQNTFDSGWRATTIRCSLLVWAFQSKEAGKRRVSEEGPRPVGDKTMITILVVEDKAEHAGIILGYLERDGYNIRFAPGGAQALEAAAAEPPDLIILDLRMPEVDGYEVCRRLREDSRTSHIPVLMFTVLDQLEQIERGVEVDADDYVVKFSSPQEVRFRVEKLLEVRHITSKAQRMIEYLRLIEGPRPSAPEKL